MTTDKDNFRTRLIRVSKIHFIFAVILAGQIILYDTSKLITPEILLRRWLMVAILLCVSAGVWYFAKIKSIKPSYDRILLFLLIITDIALASYNIYSQRGMASRAVMLYSIPILVSAIYLKRAAIYATALICISSYTLTAIAYFVWNFNEGYKVELYGETLFYSAVFLLIAGLISTIIPKKT